MKKCTKVSESNGLLCKDTRCVTAVVLTICNGLDDNGPVRNVTNPFSLINSLTTVEIFTRSLNTKAAL